MPVPAHSTYELYATLPAPIAVRIGHAIVEREFEPGRKLREVDLAASFGVSRASVREALRMVEREGLVTILPQRGARVTVLSALEVQDIFEIRANLMGLACHRLALAPTEVRENLPALLKDLRSVRDDGEAHARASLTISEFCVRHAGSSRLAELILSFGRQTARYTRLSLSTASGAGSRMATGASVARSRFSTAVTAEIKASSRRSTFTSVASCRCADETTKAASWTSHV